MVASVLVLIMYLGLLPTLLTGQLSDQPVGVPVQPAGVLVQLSLSRFFW